jgi:hypothetical protein
MACTAWLSKVLVKSCIFQEWVCGVHKSETVEGSGEVVISKSKWSWMEFQTRHQGADQTEVLPAWI